MAQDDSPQPKPQPQPPPGGKNGPSAWRTLGQLSTLGIAMVAAVAIGLGIGYGLDRLLGTEPWLTMLFALLGIVAAFLNLFRDLRKFGQW
jgi:ATP synthase protein I